MFFLKTICCGYSFELHRQVDAIQMSTHSIYFYKEVGYSRDILRQTACIDVYPNMADNFVYFVDPQTK